MPTAVARACAELVIHSTHDRGPRDILVFASGERDIHDFENALRRHYGPRAADMRRRCDRDRALVRQAVLEGAA